MLHKKKDKESNLEAIKKGSAKIIKLSSPEEKNETDTAKEGKKGLLPPVDKFNSRYYKGKDHDPL